MIAICKGGRANIDGVKMRVPTNLSILNLFAVNRTVDGGEFRDDGWVYKKGRRIRRWFKKRLDITIWPPHENDLTYLYPIYKRARERYIASWDSVKETLGKIRRTGVLFAHCKPYHKYEKPYLNGGVEDWWLWKIDTNGTYSGFSFDWVAKPKKLINLKLGEEMYYREHIRNNSLVKRMNTVGSIFMNAIEKSLPICQLDRLSTCNTVMNVTVGDMKFVFVPVLGRYGYNWKCLGDNSSVVDLKLL